MHDPSRPTPPTDPHHAIRFVAGRLLDAHLEDLTLRAVARVHSEEPDYASSEVNRDDLTRMMRRTLALALTRLAGRPIPGTLAGAAEEAGRLRAEQGLPLSAVLHAFRIDLRILWQAIIAEGRATGLAASESFIESSVLVWEAVEANTADVVDAYRRAEQEMSYRLDELRRAAFERLVADGERDPGAVQQAAKRLDLPGEARFLVLVGESVPPRHDAIRTSAAGLRARGVPSYVGWSGDDLAVAAVLTGRSLEDVLPLFDGLAAWRCGVCVVEGLAGVPRGLRLARAVIRGSADVGVRLLSSSWTAAVMSADGELSSALVQEVLGPLLALPAQERAAVFETLSAYLEGEGSVSDVAAQIYRHRNTVRNRLQAVERMTGLQLSRPRDLATLTLAVQWLHGPAGRALLR